MGLEMICIEAAHRTSPEIDEGESAMHIAALVEGHVEESVPDSPSGSSL